VTLYTVQSMRGVCPYIHVLYRSDKNFLHLLVDPSILVLTYEILWQNSDAVSLNGGVEAHEV